MQRDYMQRDYMQRDYMQRDYMQHHSITLIMKKNKYIKLAQKLDKMGTTYSTSAPLTKKINFEDMQTQTSLGHPKSVIINTLAADMQQCLIRGTLPIDQEVNRLNELLTQQPNVLIIIYAMNCTDASSVKKYEQLINLGFTNIYIYPGGLFEWLLLQDVFGRDMFPTTTHDCDILKYKGKAALMQPMLQN